MVLSSFMDTLDIVADRYIKEALSMAHTLGLFGSYAAIQSRRRRHVYSITAWGLFGLHGYLSLFTICYLHYALLVVRTKHGIHYKRGKRGA